MTLPEIESVCRTTTVEDISQFNEYLRAEPTGILLVAQEGPVGTAVSIDAADFVKWARTSGKDVAIQTQRASHQVIRQSIECWLPLAFLANEISLPVYLNLVSSYLYEKLKGALAGDRGRVHLSALYKDEKSGIVKKFEFRGDKEALDAAIQKFDINKFMK